uniref:Putative methyltransferase n=1 Tax=viral metagenome TaxID=1070528 RepID=A0A6M3J0R6_9ZZZZ
MLERDRQQCQLEVFRKRIQQEGWREGPVRLATYLKPHQQKRMQWLKAHAVGSVLEVGCSWGYVSAYVGAEAGVDINPDNIMVARILSPEIEFREGDALALPFPNKSFDTVLLTEVLEHMPWERVAKACREAIRVARKRVLVTMPDGETDTEDAANVKHAWLATRQRVLEVGTRFLPPKGCISRDSGFAFIICELE